MLNYYEEKFWEDFKKEILLPVELLIENKYDVAAAKLICSSIDAISGFYANRIKPGQVRETFLKFLKNYMPKFFELEKYFKDNLLFTKNEESVESAANILYFAFRNGLMHDGLLGLGVEIYRDKKPEVLWSMRSIQIMRLNIIGFWEYFKIALDKYELNLEKDKELYKKFKNKYIEIKSPLFKLLLKSCK